MKTQNRWNVFENLHQLKENQYNHQQTDQNLVQAQQQNPAQVPIHTINRMNIINIIPDLQQVTLWRIYLSQSLLNDVVE